jgi:hypothetical protein
MLSEQECKEVLEKDGNQFTDEEIRRIREFLYNMARVVFEVNENEENSGKREKI